MATRTAMGRWDRAGRARALEDSRVAAGGRLARYSRELQLQTKAQQAIMRTAAAEARRAQQEQQQRQQQYELQQRQASFARIQPYLEQLSPSAGGPVGPSAKADEQTDGPALQAITSSIEQRGAEAQGRLSTEMARRGIFRSGPSAAASARMTGETEAAVATSRAHFAESASQRKQRDIESRRRSLISLIGSFA